MAVTKVEQVEWLKRQEPVGHPGRNLDPIVRRELTGLDDRPPGTGHDRPDIDQRHERPPGRHDPSVELVTVVMQPAQDTGRRGRQVGLDERCPGDARQIGRDAVGGVVAGPPQLTKRAARVGVPDDRAVADAGELRGRPFEAAHDRRLAAVPASSRIEAAYRRRIGA